MNRILKVFCLLASVSAKASNTCEGYVAFDGREEGLQRVVYLAQVEEVEPDKAIATLHFVVGTQTYESVKYECSRRIRNQWCHPISEGATLPFPMCMRISKSHVFHFNNPAISESDMRGYYFDWYTDFKCNSNPKPFVGNAVCR